MDSYPLISKLTQVRNSHNSGYHFAVKLSLIADSYHHCEDVATHSLMVESLSSVQNACSWVEAELPQAEWIGAAQEGKGQLVLLVFIYSTDLQDLSPSWCVFRDIHLIPRLRELWSMVVGVNDTNKHLLGTYKETLKHNLTLDLSHSIHHKCWNNFGTNFSAFSHFHHHLLRKKSTLKKARWLWK